MQKIKATSLSYKVTNIKATLTISAASSDLSRPLFRSKISFALSSMDLRPKLFASGLLQHSSSYLPYL